MVTGSDTAGELQPPWHLLQKQPASCKHSIFLECIDDNFLIQVIASPNREEVLLDLLLPNTDGFGNISG